MLPPGSCPAAFEDVRPVPRVVVDEVPARAGHRRLVEARDEEEEGDEEDGETREAERDADEGVGVEQVVVEEAVPEGVAQPRRLGVADEEDRLHTRNQPRGLRRRARRSRARDKARQREGAGHNVPTKRGARSKRSSAHV